ncbi:pyridoxamine 5'-phosphate oxidase family protein [Actinotalea sp. K2]|uniref:pyridoxamine 5'-phosphate oxidase family protein n=1 Tax=Actinotalea sp. K2 TaxID=2939438 RepID=UPI002017D550|nr:pyridoxamine 5'-phosphate oxidase family protein [Actinotalea sp. K2]MCL3859703.1 pyridoxamine 5'-phosphate oxidase family protein [Actinotalea sp. K2]
MTTTTEPAEPSTELDPQYSSPGATATPWATARDRLRSAGTYVLGTVRPDGRPHATTVIAVWHDDALWFCTGPHERKARNLADNPHCVLSTGTGNDLHEGLDLVVEGGAEQVRDGSVLRHVVDAYVEKYGEQWRFVVDDGELRHGEGHRGLVFRVAPRTVFGFAKGEPFSQTRWRFPAGR